MRICDNVEVFNVGDCSPVLVWDTSDLVLIDTGFPMQFDLLKSAVESAGFSVDKITKIILTHQDIDHIGNVKEIQANALDVKVCAHVDEAPYIDGQKTPVKLENLDSNYDSLPDDLKAWRDKLKAGFANRRIPIDTLLNDKEVLDCCGGIEVIHTPGHTPGHICLYLKQSKVLVAGDGVIVENGKLCGPEPKYAQDLSLAVDSLKRLEPYDISAIVAYHGGLCKGDIKSDLNAIIENR